jgi:hypothetical protein
VAKTSPAEQPPIPQKLTSEGITIHWEEPGQKGGVERVMDVRAQSGDLEQLSQSGTLRNATGTAYREDKPRATFDAPVVNAAKDRKTVTATGGVTVHSVDPSGMTVRADHAIWHVEQNQVVAEGNVNFEYRKPGVPGLTAWGGPFPKMTFDTKMQKLEYHENDHIPTREGRAR